MRLHAICGFLGSGKTTLLRRVLAERAGRERVAVIVNEFGDVGIDGTLLAGQSVDMIEISAGCLCCTLKGSLLNAVEELRDKAGAERVVIEATGVAQPAELVDVLADPALKGSVTLGPVVTVVDAAKFPALRKVLGEFYATQVRQADVVLLNKTDLVSAEGLDALRRQIGALNPRATVIPTERCAMDLDTLLGTTPGSPEPSALEQGLASPAPAASFVSFVLDAAFDADRAAVGDFFAGLPATMVRAKGFMSIDGTACLVQFAAGQLEIAPPPAATRRTVVFIASGEPDRAAIEAAFRRTARIG